MKTQERTNDKNNDEEIEKIKWKKEEKNLKKRKKTALSKMNRELLEVHVLGVRNAIRLEHKQHQRTNVRTNERSNEQPDYHTIE